MKSAIRRLFASVLIAGMTYAAALAQSAITPSSGKALCAALTPADFTKAGVPVSGLRQANLDGTDGAYCVYESKAGNVEFDIFFPAGPTPGDVAATEKTVLGEVGGKFESIQIAGADAARIILTDVQTASIVVRKGKAVFDINIPKNANARQQLVALAQLVLNRLKQ